MTETPGEELETLVTVTPTPVPVVTPKFTPTPTAVPGQPTLLFSDDFDGTALDTNRWTTCYWWAEGKDGCTIISDNELEWYRPDNVLVSDGSLKLRGQEQTFQASNGRTYDYTSGMVTTGRTGQDDPLPDRFAFQHGYAEIRARVPRGQGLWSSFWLLPSDQGWPPQIDAMILRGDQPNEMTMGVYFNYEDGGQGRNSRPWRGPDLSAGWHTFAVEWQPEGLAWYVDGVKRWADNDPQHVPGEQMYLILNLAIRGDYPGPPDSDTPFPSDFEIDYVKVWSERPQ
jgi:beta-glucanase (GH16 family)